MFEKVSPLSSGKKNATVTATKTTRAMPCSHGVKPAQHLLVGNRDAVASAERPWDDTDGAAGGGGMRRPRIRERPNGFDCIDPSVLRPSE
jgi:hypothetical protein